MEDRESRYLLSSIFDLQTLRWVFFISSRQCVPQITFSTA
jgi:hypothetical protein